MDKMVSRGNERRTIREFSKFDAQMLAKLKNPGFLSVCMFIKDFALMIGSNRLTGITVRKLN